MDSAGEYVAITSPATLQSVNWEDCAVFLLSFLSTPRKYQVLCSCELLFPLEERLVGTGRGVRIQAPGVEVWSQRPYKDPVFLLLSQEEFARLGFPVDVFIAVKTFAELVTFTVSSYSLRCAEMHLSSLQSSTDEELFSDTVTCSLHRKRSISKDKPTHRVDIGLYRDLDQGDQCRFYVVIRLVWTEDWQWVRLWLHQLQSWESYVLLGQDFTFVPVPLDPKQPLRLAIRACEDGELISKELFYPRLSLLALRSVEAGVSEEEFHTQQWQLRADLEQFQGCIETWKLHRKNFSQGCM